MLEVPFPCLSLVTDRHQFGNRLLEVVVDKAIHGGVNLVQLREKDLPSSKLLVLACRLREVTAGRALLFINDRVDVALASGADGVQLGELGLPIGTARKLSKGRLLLGRSVHSVQGAQEAAAGGSDMLLVGNIFPTRSHSMTGAFGVELLRQVRDRVQVPFLGIGGINTQNVESVIEAGAYGIAVISAIATRRDPAQAASDLMNKLMNSRSSNLETGVISGT